MPASQQGSATEMIDIPASLVESVKSGTVVLVMGAGASVGARTPEGEYAPTAPELARRLAERFLGGQHDNDPLPVVAELAISETDLQTVQEFIAEIFDQLEPTAFHRLIPSFRWAALATTNFDRIIEKTYQEFRDPQQELATFIRNGDRVADKMISPRSLMLLKLHGCISRTADDTLPLILSVDQYLNYPENRERVFNHLENLAYEHTLVFIGQSLRDSDLRALLQRLGSHTNRPRYYTVTPDISDPESRFWQAKRITPIKATFEQFLVTLDDHIPSPFRAAVAAPTSTQLHIADRFIVKDPGLSSRTIDFLQNEVHYVYNGMPVEGIDPRLFYRGHTAEWSAIERGLDARRDIEERILLDVVLTDSQRHQTREFYCIRGHAGSGKSVLLQRLAWEAAITYEKIVLKLRQNARLQLEPLRELSQIVHGRVYLFIDDIDDHIGTTLDLLNRSKQEDLPLTIIGTARINEWNITCSDLEPHLSGEFTLGYLSPQEIDELLGLLDEHNSLHRLQGASREQRREAFVERAGRQLLVALHEATLGRPFEDIVADEYAEIQPEAARLIYRGICFLNRLDVPVRAGLISRVFDVRFTDFKRRFFQPLEGLVSANYDRRANDFVYTARHPHVAEIVIERSLHRRDERLTVYTDMIKGMNLDYSSDNKAFRRLIRGRSVHSDFPDHEMAQQVYFVAGMTCGTDAHFFQQRALYEMRRPNGDLNQALNFLNEAKGIRPNDHTISHSLAELHLTLAERTENSLQFTTHIREAHRLAESLTNQSVPSAHGFHTLAKIGIVRLRRLCDNSDERMPSLEFSEIVRDVEKAIRDGLQRFPDEQYLLMAEADLGHLVADDMRAMQALSSAFSRNPHVPLIAIRLARVHLAADQTREAKDVYESALRAGVHDKQLHYQYARYLIDHERDRSGDILYHLRRSFNAGDSNASARFWYARQLYINGDFDDAQAVFRDLSMIPVSLVTQRKIQGVLCRNGLPERFRGKVDSLSGSFGFALRDGSGDNVFLHVRNMEDDIWRQLRSGTPISFGLGFNFRGAVAIRVELD